MLSSPILLACFLFPVVESAEEPVHTVYQRAFKVPVQLDPGRRNEIEKVTLFVSTDRGVSWQRTSSIGPNETFFRYSAPTEGVYWFAVQIAMKDKTQESAEQTPLAPALKVSVEKPKDAETRMADLEKEVRELRAETKRLQELLTALEQRLSEKK